MPLDLARLRRRPDVEHATLQAHDAADRLLLDEAAPLLSAAASDLSGVVVIGDTHGALTLSLLVDLARPVRQAAGAHRLGARRAGARRQRCRGRR
ncbi:hypothetical protein [Salana multivorans]